MSSSLSRGSSTNNCFVVNFYKAHAYIVTHFVIVRQAFFIPLLFSFVVGEGATSDYRCKGQEGP